MTGGQLLSNAERELSALNETWADFARRLRIELAARKRGGHIAPGLATLRQVAAMFGLLKQRFDGGDRSALLDAVSYAATENVPLPRWVADGFLAALASLDKRPASLHEVFGFERRYPTTQKRWRKAAADRQTKVKLFAMVSQLIAEGMGKAAAVKQACCDLPIQPRIAWDWFSEAEATHRKTLAAWEGRGLHKFD